MFEQGMRVRIKETAFGDSQEPADVYARGKVGTLVREEDDRLWLWRDEAGHEAFPVEDELVLLPPSDGRRP